MPGGVNFRIESFPQIGQVPMVVVKPGLVNQFGLNEGGKFLKADIAWVGEDHRAILFIVVAIAIQVIELDVCGHAQI